MPRSRWQEGGGSATALRTEHLVLSTWYITAWLMFSAAIVSFAGCGGGVSGGGPISVSAGSPNFRVVPMDGEALDDLIAAHNGQVVLIDYWATWCLPCVENFPHTVALAKKYREQGLVAIGVSFDRLEDEPRVREFLAQKGADFDNVISQHDSIGQKAFADFDVGPLPEYRLYDRQGKLRKKWEGGIEQAELEKKIVELLAEPSAERGTRNAE